jgi:hypothetical protein
LLALTRKIAKKKLREGNMRPNALLIAICYLPIAFKFRTAGRAATAQDCLAAVVNRDREVKVKVCYIRKQLVPNHFEDFKSYVFI